MFPILFFLIYRNDSNKNLFNSVVGLGVDHLQLDKDNEDGDKK
jgi:hypothetical protein